MLDVFIMWLLARLFFEPAHYRLKAKGWRAGFWLWPAIGLCALGEVLAFTGWLGGLLFWGTPALLWLLSHVLPYRADALGKSWLKISGTCPACAYTFSFGRRHEGFAVRCPACGEVLTIPGTRVGQAVGDVLGAVPGEAAQDWVPVFRSFLPVLVELARQRLESAAIEVFEPDAIMAHVYPGTGPVHGGWRVMVPAAQAEQARALLTTPAADELPREMETTPEPEAEPVNDGTALFIFEILFMVCCVTPLIMTLWEWTVPHLFPQAVAAGKLPAALEWKIMMRFVFVWFLARLSFRFALRHRAD